MQFWKSNARHWCDVCRCWMADTKQAIQHHERGMGHQGNVQRKLREMTRKSDQEKRDTANLNASMAKIEAAANKQYLEDLMSTSLTSVTAGTWKWDAPSSFYYNAVHDAYYDPKSHYYGIKGEWKLNPPLPEVAKFGTAAHEGGPVAIAPSKASSTQATAGQGGPSKNRPGLLTSASATALLAHRGVGASGSTALPGHGSSVTNVKGMGGIESLRTKTTTLSLPSHPLASIGGHSGPTMGRVGAAKGLTDLSSDSKRKREEEGQKGGKGATTTTPAAPMSAEEAAAHARREAARQRVALRTAQGYGFA